MTNEPNPANRIGALSRIKIVAGLLGAYAAAHVAAVGVVHAFCSPDAPIAMPPGGVLTISAAAASAAPADFHCSD
jgi:hypothetical protein